MREKIVPICPTPQARTARQIGTTGSLRMARMRELPAAEGVTRHLIDS
jgi:hypothetical protein